MPVEITGTGATEVVKVKMPKVISSKWIDDKGMEIKKIMPNSSVKISLKVLDLNDGDRVTITIFDDTDENKKELIEISAKVNNKEAISENIQVKKEWDKKKIQIKVKDNNTFKEVFTGAKLEILKEKIKIKAKQNSYTVVLDKNGNLFSGYPNLEFEITDGNPGDFIDIQVVKKDDALLIDNKGIVNSWDKTKLPKDRVSVKTFSSWTNGDTNLQVDGVGKVTYTMPLDWWRDLARQPKSDFSLMTLYFKVLAFPSSTDITPSESSSKSNTEIHNNLVDFKINDFGYISGGTVKSMSMEFTVKEAGTTEMYTFVQWKMGGRQNWDNAKNLTRPNVQDYGIRHISDYPQWTIDRVGTNPRYWDGNYQISADAKKATATDKPSSVTPNIPLTHTFTFIDFETRVHLNADVPMVVTITRQDGSPPVYGIVIGIIPPPEPLILDNDTWNSRILQIRNTTTGAITITHPLTFTGP
ncbi:MAG: OmpH family outer membrane protein [Bacteroidales bacterium]|jgi:hypothetical protein|nr:OmpH family outer membrane protein [Bacteroidales bacterium]